MGKTRIALSPTPLDSKVSDRLEDRVRELRGVASLVSLAVDHEDTPEHLSSALSIVEVQLAAIADDLGAVAEGSR